MKLATLVATSAVVARTSGRNVKRDAVAACLADLGPGEVAAGVHYLSGSLPQGRVGVGPSLLRHCAVPAAAAGAVVYVEPKLVVEIAFNDVQTSPHYPGGVALRFARVKRYRQDKAASEADTIGAVRALLP